MKTDIELKNDAMQILRDHLGLVESERFITLITREGFDYTRWRQDQWNDISLAQIADQARKLRKQPNVN